MKNSYRSSDAHPVAVTAAGLSREMVELIEDILAGGLKLRIRATGKSMTPFLRGCEILTIKKSPDCSLRKGDLIFSRKPGCHPVLHRIIDIQQSGDGRIYCRTKGDALDAADEPVTGAEILGKVCRIEDSAAMPGLKQIDLESHFWGNANYAYAFFLRVMSRSRSLASGALIYFREMSGAREGS